MTNMEGGDLVLKAGSTYVLGATQDIRLYPNNGCYRWPTSQHPDGVDQFYGKYEPQSDGTFANAGTENLGTGWMRAYTDRGCRRQALDRLFLRAFRFQWLRRGL